MTCWMLYLWFDLQLTYFYFWSEYDFGQRMTRYDEWFLAIFEPTSISFLVSFRWPESLFWVAELSGRQTSCWHHDVHFDVMTYFWTLWHILWHTFWCYLVFFDVMIFWHRDILYILFDVMTYFLTSWNNFVCHPIDI